MPPGEVSYESQQLPGGGGTKGKKEKVTQLEAAQKSDCAQPVTSERGTN